MERRYKLPFRQFVKKAHRALQLAIEDEVDGVCANPACGEAKKGDLAGILVHKFKFHRQEYLMAYRPQTGDRSETPAEVVFLVIDFYQIGTHENFYEDLKRYLRSESP